MKQSTIKKREKQLLYLLKQAIEHTDEAVMITNANLKDPGPKIVYVNQALCKMTGYTQKEFLGRSPRLLQGSQTNNLLLNEITKKLRAGQPCNGYVINYRKDGSEIHMELDIAPIWGDKNKITHYISIQRDITKSIKKEIEKEEVLGEFDHGIKTHLATIKGYLQLVEKKSADPKITHYIHSADVELNKILKLMLNVKDARTSESNNIIMQVEKFDVDNIISQTIKNVKVVNKTHKIARRGKVNQKLQIDAFRISQVIEHLLTNAIKYSPNANRVTIRAKKELKSITISVEDEGKGIAIGEQEKIFERFYTSSSHKEDAESKTGIGLYLASEIIKAHGGAINVQSAPGKGSIFSFTLPLKNKNIRKNITELFSERSYSNGNGHVKSHIENSYVTSTSNYTRKEVN